MPAHSSSTLPCALITSQLMDVYPMTRFRHVNTTSVPPNPPVTVGRGVGRGGGVQKQARAMLLTQLHNVKFTISKAVSEEEEECRNNLNCFFCKPSVRLPLSFLVYLHVHNTGITLSRSLFQHFKILNRQICTPPHVHR